MVQVAEERAPTSDLRAFLPTAVVWSTTIITVSMLLLVAVLIVSIPRGSSGLDGIVEFLGVLLAGLVIGLSSLVGTVSALIGLKTRYGSPYRRSLRAGLAINGVALLCCLGLYVIGALAVPG